jgi:hypothetical protein
MVLAGCVALGACSGGGHERAGGAIASSADPAGQEAAWRECADLDLRTVGAVLGRAVAIDPTRSRRAAEPPALRSVRCVLVTPGQEGSVTARSVGSLSFSSFRSAAAARTDVEAERRHAVELGLPVVEVDTGDGGYASLQAGGQWYCATAIGPSVAGVFAPVTTADAACRLAGEALRAFAGRPR